MLGTGPASLAADVVRSNRGNAVVGSQVNLFRAGERDVIVGQATTDTNGHVNFAGIPAGSYDLTFAKSNSAGSALLGAVATAGVNTRFKVVQFDQADPNASKEVPTLKLEIPTGLTATGEVAGWTDLKAGATFEDTVNVRATVQNASAEQPLRYFLFSLGTFDASGNWADLRTAEGVATQDPGTTPAPGGNGADSGLISLSASGLSGPIYLQVVGIDFNYNRVAYLVPITLSRSAASATVTAPTNVQATAYTLRERIDYLASVKDAPSSGSNLWVTVAWTAPADLAGYTGFRVLRATAAAGPYVQVAIAGDKQCAAPARGATTRRCSVSDSSATLQTDQDYFYRVVALGANEASSAAPTGPSTHTLPAFEPALLAPAQGARGVDLLPVYTLKTNLPASATGFYMDLWVTDWLTGYSNAYSSGRLNFRRGLAPDGSTEFQGILNVSGTNKFVYRSSNPAQANFISYDAASDTLGIPHQYEFGPELFNSKATPLQAARRYAWFLNKAYAYRLQDPTKTQNSTTNPIVAYSVYSDPTIPLAVPGGAQQQYTEIHDFTTRP
ncbi:carboxypeptidase-like regulatory domain-containing protein [Deinococcus sp. VB343]|uniref:carboxypeptidase-like regulatory domain-containing protein n=1 Tax=Deinococcus sp. VB343 TaxID=3385567 RepID=UPI0039C8CE00